MPSAASIEAARLKAKKAVARLRELESLDAAKKRKIDTRSKILVGAAFLADADKNTDTRRVIETVLKRNITKSRDIEVLQSCGWLKD